VNVLVMGGTRLMGEAVVRRLLGAGHVVTVFNRGTRDVPWAGEVRWIIADRDDPAGIVRLRDHEPDVVVDFSAYRPDQTASLLEVIPPGAGVVYCSSGSVYAPQPTVPWPETTPYGPSPLWGAYARDKLACELLLRAAADQGRPVVVFRLPYVLGPRNYAPREEFVLNRLLDRAEIAIPGDGLAPQQFITAEQVAESVGSIVAAGAMGGFTDVNLADPDAVASPVAFVRLCADVCGMEPVLRSVPPGPAGTAAGPIFNALDCVFPFPNAPYVLDLAKAAGLGWLPAPRPLRQAIEAAFEVLMTEPGRRSWARTPAEQAALGGAS
jgi:nucleoside-diphosphate-sugar epimerase